MKQTNKIKAVVVSFDQDNVSALYLDGKLATTNSDYDTNPVLAFESFIGGIEWSGKETSPIEWLEVWSDRDDDFPSNKSNVPKQWPDGKFSKRAE